MPDGGSGSEAPVRVQDHGGTAVLVFSRPPSNAFNLALTREFASQLLDLQADPPSGGLVLTGAGPRFSGGVDHREVPGYEPAQAAEMITKINAGLTLLYGIRTATSPRSTAQRSVVRSS